MGERVALGGETEPSQRPANHPGRCLSPRRFQPSFLLLGDFFSFMYFFLYFPGTMHLLLQLIYSTPLPVG